MKNIFEEIRKSTDSIIKRFEIKVNPVFKDEESASQNHLVVKEVDGFATHFLTIIEKNIGVVNTINSSFQILENLRL